MGNISAPSRVWAFGLRLLVCSLALFLTTVSTARARSSSELAAGLNAAGLSVSWRYHSAESLGQLRLYRGADWGHLEPVLELPVETGRHLHRVETGTASSRPAVFQLRFVSPSGAEVVLGTVTWNPPRIEALPGLASGATPGSALLFKATEAPRRPPLVALLDSASRVGSRPPNIEPLVPPPKGCCTLG